MMVQDGEMNQSLLQAIYGVIAKVLQKEVVLEPDTPLWQVGMDSIGIVHVVAQCEDEFEIEFEPEDLTMAKLQTPHDIVRLLQEKYSVVLAA